MVAPRRTLADNKKILTSLRSGTSLAQSSYILDTKFIVTGSKVTSPDLPDTHFVETAGIAFIDPPPNTPIR
jgi:hypothetical protein